MIFIVQIIQYWHFMNLCLNRSFSQIFRFYFLVLLFLLQVVFLRYDIIFDNWNFMNMALLWWIFWNIQFIFLNIFIILEFIHLDCIFIAYLYLMNLSRLYSLCFHIIIFILQILRHFNCNFNIVLNLFLALIMIWNNFQLQICDFRMLLIFRRYLVIKILKEL